MATPSPRGPYSRARVARARVARVGWSKSLAALALACLALGLTSCARSGQDSAETTPPERQRPGYALPGEGYLTLALKASGDFEPLASNGRPPERVAEPFPTALAAAAIQPLRTGAVLTVNRLGLFWLAERRYEPASPEARAEARLLLERIPGADAAFGLRTAASSWARDGRALVLLYRHPVYEATELAGPASMVIAASEYRAEPYSPPPGDDAYAVYPISTDSWLVQYRREAEDRVLTEYAVFKPDAASGTERSPLDRAHFERLLAPLPLGAAPVELRAALGALAGPLLVEASLADGSRRAFSRGDPGEAAPAWAHVTGAPTAHGGVAAAVVTDDWRLALASSTSTGYAVRLIELAAPLPGATARGVAMVGSLAVIIWEEGAFPAIASSGILALETGL